MHDPFERKYGKLQMLRINTLTERSTKSLTFRDYIQLVLFKYFHERFVLLHSYNKLGRSITV